MIYFFYGDEEFNISNEIKKFKSKLDVNFIEMSCKHYKNPKFPDLMAAVQAQPMMFGKMLTVIDCLGYFTGKSGEDKAFDDKQLAELAKVLDGCSENTDIIFVAQFPPDGTKKIDKRRKIFKLLSKYNPQEFLQIPSYKTSELEAWIKNQAKGKDLKISSDAASAMLLQIGSNLRLLDSELEKLKVFANGKQVTVDMIKEICTTNEDVFIFADYLVKGNQRKALEEYTKLIAKKHPLEILSFLHTHLHNSIRIKAYSAKYSSDEIAKMMNMHPYRVKLALQKLKSVSMKDIVKLKRNLTNSEYKFKTGKSAMDIEREVEYAILQ